MTLGVSADMLGRVFDGLGPADVTAAPRSSRRRDTRSTGPPINPTARDFPDDFIQTGISSSIDGLNPLVRGQKLPIFSGSGCRTTSSRRRLRVRRQVAGGGAGDFAVVFAAMGITFEDADFFMTELARRQPSSARFSSSTSPTTPPSRESRHREWL
jgi:V/A-type H+/Na+-transporting ATPase subunit B